MSNQDLTEQERQLIECLRRLKEPDEVSITVTREDGAWQIGMSAGKSPGKIIKGRGDDDPGLIDRISIQ